MNREVARALGAPVRWLLLGLIAAYRATLARALPPRCRFHPSCSAYAFEAVRVHGALKGFLMAGWRLLRCSPLSPGGLDPVPSPGSWRSGSVV